MLLSNTFVWSNFSLHMHVWKYFQMWNMTLVNVFFYLERFFCGVSALVFFQQWKHGNEHKSNLKIRPERKKKFHRIFFPGNFSFEYISKHWIFDDVHNFRILMPRTFFLRWWWCMAYTRSHIGRCKHEIYNKKTFL